MAKPIKMIPKSVTFNVLDDHQKTLYDYVANKSNFSGYVKRLIDRDMLGAYQPIKAQEQSEVEFDFNSFV